MTWKTKTGSFYALIRHLFLVLLLCSWLKKLKQQVLWVNKSFVSGSFTSFLTSKTKAASFCALITFIPCSFAWFKAIKLETGIFWDLIKILFLVLLLRLWLQKPALCLLCIDKTFVSCSFAWFMAIKIETRTFWDLIKISFFVLFLRLWLQKLTPEVFMAWQDLCCCSCVWFFPTRDETLTRRLFLLLRL